MMTCANWNEINEKNELARLRGDLALSSPESYTAAEAQSAAAGMIESAMEIEAAIRADFGSMPPQAQAAMLQLLEKADPGNMDYWHNLLGLEMPTSLSEIA